MKTNVIEFIPLNESQIDSIGKLLHFSWSAEYQLRLSPVMADDEYKKTAVEWVLPMAFHACRYSLRAALITVDCATDVTLALVTSATSLHLLGLYNQTGLPIKFFEQLNALHANPDHYRKLQIDVLSEQQRLQSIVEQVAMAHEGRILQAIGVEAFTRIVKGAKSYIWADFIEDRFDRLLGALEEKEVVLC